MIRMRDPHRLTGRLPREGVIPSKLIVALEAVVDPNTLNAVSMFATHFKIVNDPITNIFKSFMDSEE